MARLPALVSVLGRHDPRGEVTIENYGRILRKAKKITPSKRGVGAADLTVSDATNLIFGLAEIMNAQYAPAAVNMLRGALPMGVFEGQLDPLDALADYDWEVEYDTLGELVESILRLYGPGMQMPPKKSGAGAIRSISLRMENPSIFGGSAFVTFDVGPTEKIVLQYFYEHYDLSFGSEDIETVEKYMAKMREADAHPQASKGISFDVTISFPVLVAVARCIQSGGGDS